MKSPVLIPLAKVIRSEQLLEVAPTGSIYACDFTVEGVESWHECAWGYEQGRIRNIDHHADTPLMRRRVSSANLALLRVAEAGAATASETVVINHTDCDSVLSAAIMCGAVEPLPELGEAAIAADHTGEVNAIADLLQALDRRRDYDYSLECLKRLLRGAPLDGEAHKALDARAAKRELAARLVSSGAIAFSDGVATVVTPEMVDGELLPPLLPHAWLIVSFSPRPGEANRWNCKARIGNAAPQSLALSRVMKAVDPNYGGRWNAGSNTRGGGSAVDPETYIAKVIEQVKLFADKNE